MKVLFGARVETTKPIGLDLANRSVGCQEEISASLARVPRHGRFGSEASGLGAQTRLQRYLAQADLSIERGNPRNRPDPEGFGQVAGGRYVRDEPVLLDGYAPLQWAAWPRSPNRSVRQRTKSLSLFNKDELWAARPKIRVVA
jgi:hypothetical protein